MSRKYPYTIHMNFRTQITVVEDRDTGEVAFESKDADEAFRRYQILQGLEVTNDRAKIREQSRIINDQGVEDNPIVMVDPATPPAKPTWFRFDQDDDFRDMPSPDVRDEDEIEEDDEVDDREFMDRARDYDFTVKFPAGTTVVVPYLWGYRRDDDGHTDMVGYALTLPETMTLRKAVRKIFEGYRRDVASKNADPRGDYQVAYYHTSRVSDKIIVTCET